MANTLTDLIPDMYQGLDVVSRELTGFIPAVTRNSAGEGAALNETINIPVVGAVSTGNITPGQTAPDDGDFTPANTTMTISKSKYAPIRWNGEEQVGVGNSGMYGNVNSDRFAQAIRALVNEVEADLAGLHIHSSRAYGTAGTTPYGTANVLTDMSKSLEMLEQNGAPLGDVKGVYGSAAIANLRGLQSVLFKVNEAGTSENLRRGIIGDIHGTKIHNSGQIKTNVAGTGTSYTSAATGYAVGTTSIPIITGSGTVLAGDIVTFAGDTNKYVVKTGVTAAGTIVLEDTGLRVALPASATAMTIVGAAARNMIFSSSAMALITRAPAMPQGGDAATDVMNITDPMSGLTFQVAQYNEYRQVRYELGLAWGVKAVAPRHMVLNIG